MANEKRIYAKGIRLFPARTGSPEWVKASVLITPNELFAWLKENPSYLTEYKEQKQLKLDLLEGKDGLYLAVNVFKPKTEEASDSLPF